ncbi:MAG: serine/threonine-protein kinase [Rikenellaceae bacterium]
MQLKIGSSLKNGEYTITEVLGQVGFGITYLARQHITIQGQLGSINSSINVAIKEFFMKDCCNRNSENSFVSVGSLGSREQVEQYKQKFIKEAYNISKLSHPHIVKVADLFEENGTAYYVMEYLESTSLDNYIAENGAVCQQEATEYIRQIADALDYIHKKKINHLDVKPANILRKANSDVILIDFGVSKQYDISNNQTSSTPVGISRGYAPIEQYKTGGVGQFSPTTDIYSLGATFYKLLTGNTPPDAFDIFDGVTLIFPEDISQTTISAITTSMKPSRADRPPKYHCIFGAYLL